MTIPAREDLSTVDRADCILSRGHEASSRLAAQPAYDDELLRQFAQDRLSGSLVILILVGAIGVLSGLWRGALAAGISTAATLLVHLVMLMACRLFLNTAPDSADLRRWRRRFVLLDLGLGLALALNFIQPVGDSAATFNLLMMLLTLAVSSMLAANLPAAVFATTAPVAITGMLNFAFIGSLHGYLLGTMALIAMVYFAMLTGRLRVSALAVIAARVEKDALIGELEQAKAKSDEARRRAETANLAKSRFLAQMSHELRTPLNAILGFSEMMKNEVFGRLSPAYQDYAADIHHSGSHLLGLINEILDLSRVEAGRYELNDQPVALVAIAQDCHRLLKLRARSRRTKIHEQFETGLPPIWADERATRQICLNLLSNAVKFAPPSGQVWLKVGWTAGGGQYISIKDNGPGIPEEEIPIALATFGQGSNAIKSAEQGAGLGLPIAKNLADLHGGTFTIHSKLRKGTEVIVTFPRERVLSEPMVGAPPTQPQHEISAELFAATDPESGASLRLRA